MRVLLDEIRRGGSSSKRIVPRPAIAWVANALYNENYMALPMSHEDVTKGGRRTVSYRWRHRGEWCRLAGSSFARFLNGTPSSCFVADGSSVVVRRGLPLK